MKKKIKDLTPEERMKICREHISDNCDRCPFMLFATHGRSYYCVAQILTVLEKEVEVDEA